MYFLTLLFFALMLTLEAPALDLTAGSWESSSSDLQVTPGKDGLVLTWKAGETAQASAAGAAVPVPAGADHLKMKFTWRELSWNYGGYFEPTVTFYNQKGRRLKNQAMRMHGRASNPPISEFQIGTPKDSPITYESMVRVPAQAVSYRPGFRVRGNDLSCLVQELTLEKAEPPANVKYQQPAYQHPEKKLSREQVLAMLEKRELPSFKVVRKGNRNGVTCNGREIPFSIYKNPPCSSPEEAVRIMQRTATFGKIGFNVFTVTLPLGMPTYKDMKNSLWTGRDQYDISSLENAVYDILSYNPDALIMAEIIVSPYYDWTMEHPDDIYRREDGTKIIYRGCSIRKVTAKTIPDRNSCSYWMPSLFSENYKADAAQALKEVFSRISRTPAAKAIAGVYLTGGGDGQWFGGYDDRSPAALQSFRSYLKQKYGSDGQLRKAWQDETVSLNTVRLPQDAADADVVRHGTTLQSDHFEWLSMASADRQIAWCKAIKEGTGGRILAGGYWPETGGVHGYPHPEHRCSKVLYASPYVDLIAVVPAYQTDREPCQVPRIPGFNGSQRLHRKLHILELDLRNMEHGNWWYWGNPLYMKNVFGGPAFHFRNHVLRWVGYALAMGGTFHGYDMDAGWWDTTVGTAAWKEAFSLVAQAQAEPLSDDRMAVFLDERSTDHLSLSGQDRALTYTLKTQVNFALWRSGVPFDYYLMDDVLDSEFKAPKILVFADASTMTPAMARKIRRRYANCGRVLVWIWAPGIFAPGDETNPSQITGFKLTEDRNAFGKQIFVESSDDPLLKGITGFLNFQPRWGVGLGPNWRVAEEPGIKILANYHKTDIPAMAIRRGKNHTEIYIGQPGGLTPALCRNIAREAGVAALVSTDDVNRYGAGLLTVNSQDSGEIKVRMPKNCNQPVPLTGEKILKQSRRSFRYRSRAYGAQAFKMVPPEATR